MSVGFWLCLFYAYLQSEVIIALNLLTLNVFLSKLSVILVVILGLNNFG